MTDIVQNNALSTGFRTINRHPVLRWLQWIIGFPIHLVAFLFFLIKGNNKTYQELLQGKELNILQSELGKTLRLRYEKQYDNKQAYFNRTIDEKERETYVQAELNKRLTKLAEEELAQAGIEKVSYADYFDQLLHRKGFVVASFIPGILVYAFYFIYQQAFIRFVVERLFMTLFVILSVIVVVFTILYISPSDPAANILGEAATPDQRIAFNHQYGLDQPYLVQLWHSITGIFTFDLGNSFVGNEAIITSISNRLPVTLTLAIGSLLLAVAIAVPVGMISAAKMNSIWDYSFMFLALIGLSIPSFWQGLILILTFAIQLDWLPSTYSPHDAMSLIMPIVVLGTGLAATIARMTRSSILEVMHDDYMVTAKAKGLNGREMFIQHALRNAWIPILTVIGLQFGVMLGGAAVTEKVFNISGLGSYIVDKQFIPDTPAILAGVVYIAIVISIVNLIVDLLYALLNPRIRSQMKSN
ncbi:ABC transporter permease [Gracilibacillus sp. S3-1-1]|uniref:ABC transporter permease n=1 Tax=Gracilibacillus pellucidus TaxID=3095368 RepID=A0ACC6M367_9BACI|nr:ABC transporter permease [Gracilibacillus sp. S3-1-1]MDX8045405.1 ABC transporter permease [Gracilibacillus sp. S3-1-1]